MSTRVFTCTSSTQRPSRVKIRRRKIETKPISQTYIMLYNSLENAVITITDTFNEIEHNISYVRYYILYINLNLFRFPKQAPFIKKNVGITRSCIITY